MDFIVDDNQPGGPGALTLEQVARNLLSGTGPGDLRALGHLVEALATPVTSFGATRMQEAAAEVSGRSLAERRQLLYWISMLCLSAEISTWPLAKRQPDGSWHY